MSPSHCPCKVQSPSAACGDHSKEAAAGSGQDSSQSHTPVKLLMGGDTLAVVGHRQQCFPGVLGKRWEHFSMEKKSVNGFTVRLPVLNGRLVWKMWMQRHFLLQHEERRVAIHNCLPEKKLRKKKGCIDVPKSCIILHQLAKRK